MKYARGVGLIEVLISLLIMSIAALGAASMMLTGLRTSNNTYMETQAVVLVNDMAERIRANPVGDAQGHYNNVTTASLPTDPSCVSVNCTPEQIAKTDLIEWHRKLIDELPSAVGTVSGSGAFSVHTITISWNDQGTDGVVAARTFTLSVMP